MITKAQRKKLKIFLKHDYVSDVLQELNRLKVTNTIGQPHGESIIRNVFSGSQNNADIEEAILTVYANRKAQHAKAEKKKNKLLSA